MEFILCENVKEEKKRRIELMKLHKKKSISISVFYFQKFHGEKSIHPLSSFSNKN